MNVAQIFISLSFCRAYIVIYRDKKRFLLKAFIAPYLRAANGSINRERKKLMCKLCYIVLTGRQHPY